MEFELLYQPAMAVARVMLEPGESVRSESGAMISMSETVTLESKMPGGIAKTIGRIFGGENLFQSYFTASRGAGEVILAPGTIGDILALRLAGEGYMVTSGAYLAGDAGLSFETRTSVKGFFAGEGMFMMRISGHGPLLLNAFGAIHAVELMVGQTYLVDSGHIVAFSDSVGFDIRRAARSWMGTITSKEGVLARFIGPGVVYIQTRSPHTFGSYLGQFIPDES